MEEGTDKKPEIQILIQSPPEDERTSATDSNCDPDEQCICLNCQQNDSDCLCPADKLDRLSLSPRRSPSPRRLIGDRIVWCYDCEAYIDTSHLDWYKNKVVHLMDGEAPSLAGDERADESSGDFSDILV